MADEQNIIEEKTLKDLQKEAVELGMTEEEAGKFSVKSVLQVTIDALKRQKTQTVAPVIDNPQENKALEKQWKSKREVMREKLLKELKERPVRILVPLDPKEQAGKVEWRRNDKTGKEEQFHVSGAIQPVTLNGYQWLVPKGSYVEVPETVAQIITEKFQQTEQAGAAFKIDRVDPETGRSVRDQLS